ATRTAKPAATKKRGIKKTKKTAKKAGKKSLKKAANKAAGKTREKAPKAKAPKAALRLTAESRRAIKRAAQNAAAALAPVTKPPTAARAISRANLFYITTAIAYPNGEPHIGHAYEAIATDTLARFQRLDGKDVFFLTGTDEHGLKMVQTAEAEGVTPPDPAARNPARFRAMDERLNVSFDRFIRTTEPQHHRSSRAIWNRMQQNGDIY